MVLKLAVSLASKEGSEYDIRVQVHSAKSNQGCYSRFVRFSTSFSPFSFMAFFVLSFAAVFIFFIFFSVADPESASKNLSLLTHKIVSKLSEI
jgi:hypothetical protein